MTTDPDAPRVCISSRDVTEEIRKPETSAVISAVAVVPEVCRVLAGHMHRIIAKHNHRMVVEGRDITMVMAPDAEVQVLLTAGAAARIGGRVVKLGERADQVTVADSILRRDCDDSTVSNFAEAADGMSIVDSTRLDFGEVVAKILRLVSDA